MKTNNYLTNKIKPEQSSIGLLLTFLTILLMSVTTLPTIAQTVLISPTGDGGFESGTTFPLNGWTLVNAANGNSWCVGTAALSAGVRGAYVSTSAAGSNNNYTNYGGLFAASASRTVHFYRTVNFPAGETNIILTYKWKCNGANFIGNADNDDVKVFLAPTSVTPVSGTEVNATYLIGGPYRLQGATYQTVTMTLPAALAGTSRRLIFQWRNDNNVQGSNPAGAIDEVSLTTCAPPVVTASNTGPQCPGTNLNLSASGGGTYLWTGPNGFTSTSATPSIPSVTTDATGTYSVEVTTNGCSATNSTAVNILAAPVGAAPTTSSAAVCEGTPFTLTANAGVPNAQINATSIAIPDAPILGTPTSISSNIVVANSFMADQLLSVKINITHSYIEDIDVYLKAPNGSQIELTTDNGGSGSNYTNTVFVTGSPAISTGTAPFTGKFSPEQSFNSLTGTANGTWQLIVSDDAWLNTGTLVNWTITTMSTSGVTYTWSSTPSGFSGSGATTTTSATANTTYEVATSFGSCSSGAIGSVAVNILTPPVVNASSNAPVCDGTDLILSASGGVSYTWTGPSYSSSLQNPTINNVTQLTEGNYTIVVTDAFGCTNSETLAIDVNENPVISIVSQTDVTCNGGDDGELVVTATGGSGFYMFSAGNNSNFDGLFSGLTAGPYSIEAIDGNSCISTSGTTINEPDPTTIAFAGTDDATCFGTTATLGANQAIVGVGTWSVVSGNATFSDVNSPLAVASGLGVGPNVLAWTVDNGVCGSNFDEVTVSGIELPDAQISGSPVICNGQSALLNLNFTGSGPWTYSYSDGTSTFGPITTSNSSDIISVSPTTNKTYTVTTVSDAVCSNSGSGSATVTVNNGLPTNSIAYSGIVAPTSACAGNVINVGCNTVGNINGYTWSASDGTLVNGEVGPFTTLSPNAALTLGTLPANSSGWRVCVYASNACGSTNNLCFFIRGALSIPAPVSGDAIACENTTGFYSTLPVGGANDYNWTGSGGVNVVNGNGTTGVNVSFDPGFTQGTLCVAARLACGYSGPQRCFTIKNSLAILGAMNGPFSLCPGQTNQVFSVPSVNGIANYQWTVPSNITIVSGQGTPSLTVNVGPSFNIGQLCVTATSNCGVPTSSRCRTLSSVSPATPSNIVGPLNGICDQTVSYSIPSINGVSGYNWVLPSGATLASANGNNSVDITYSNAFTTGQVCVTAQNSCGTSVARCSNIKAVPNTPTVIVGSNSICSGEAGLSYSIAPVFGANGYLWTVPAGANIVSGANTSSIIVDWGSISGDVTVKAINNCGQSGTKVFNVNVGCRFSSSVSPEFSVFPNPASESATVTFEAKSEGTSIIQLIDISGRVVYEKMVDAVRGANKANLDLRTITKGAYIVKVNNTDNQSIGRLSVQ